jgi:hypothetical protein
MGVGRAVRVKGCSGAMAVTRVFRVRVARSSRRVRKLWTGRPSSVRPVVCLVTAAGERPALATTLERCCAQGCPLPRAAMPRDGADHHDLRGVCQGNRCGRESAEYIDDLRTPRAFSRPLASRARSHASSSALGSQRTLRWRKAASNSQSRVASRYRHVMPWIVDRRHYVPSAAAIACPAPPRTALSFAQGLERNLLWQRRSAVTRA